MEPGDRFDVILIGAGIIGSSPLPRQLLHERHPLYPVILGIRHGLIPGGGPSANDPHQPPDDDPQDPLQQSQKTEREICIEKAYAQFRDWNSKVLRYVKGILIAGTLVSAAGAVLTESPAVGAVCETAILGAAAGFGAKGGFGCAVQLYTAVQVCNASAE